VRAVAAKEQGGIFAANRARGRIALTVCADNGGTRRAHVDEEGSLRIRFPNADADECEAVIVNTAGGVVGGDHFDLAFDLETGARLVVTGAAAEKVYRSTGPDADIALRLDIAAGAALRWLPQETILFDQARLDRRIDVSLHGDASLVLAEAVVFGRSAMGEQVREGKLIDRWRVRRDGQMLFAETTRLDGRIADTLSQRVAANGGAAIATILIVPGHDELASRLCALSDQFAGEVGCSAWNGITVARLCARDGAALRHDMVMLLGAIGMGSLPRLWLN
jgi:urease accessory protein